MGRFDPGAAGCEGNGECPEQRTGRSMPTGVQPPDVLALGVVGAVAGVIRLEILELLSERPRDVSTLASQLELDIDHVSYHLRTLRRHGLVRFVRDRVRHVYHLGERARVSADESRIRVVLTVAVNADIVIEIPRGKATAAPNGAVEEHEVRGEGDPGSSVEELREYRPRRSDHRII